jgi:hypothetical protein
VLSTGRERGEHEKTRFKGEAVEKMRREAPDCSVLCVTQELVLGFSRFLIVLRVFFSQRRKRRKREETRTKEERVRRLRRISLIR